MHTTDKSMEEVKQCIEKCAAAKPEDAIKTMFIFLYKEIMVNRMHINEIAPEANRSAKDHYEKVINELNIQLMEQLKHHG